MRADDFLRLQYDALRAEIVAAQQRNHQTLAFGILGVPAINYLADRFDLTLVRIVLPLVLVVIALMYVADNHGIIRCGAYIRHFVEPHVEGVLGWETWLERGGVRNARSTERYLSLAFFLLFAVYYLGAASLAYQAARDSYTAGFGITVLVGYSVLGLWFVIHLIRAIRLSTDEVSVMQAPPPKSGAV